MIPSLMIVSLVQILQLRFKVKLQANKKATHSTGVGGQKVCHLLPDDNWHYHFLIRPLILVCFP